MKIFGWMQNKIGGRNGNKNPDSTSHNYQADNESCKQEFSDWPHGLLAIGTFGNKDMKTIPSSATSHLHNHPSSSQDPSQEPEPEETGKVLQHDQDGPTNDNIEYCKDSCPEFGTGVVHCEEKGLSVDKKFINKKSFSFLLKKMFVCGSKFTPTPCLRDHVAESRMEKILRAILYKKINPQNPNQIMSMKRCLENKENLSKSVNNSDSDDDINEKADDGSTWVRTDSEYIVLEI